MKKILMILFMVLFLSACENASNNVDAETEINKELSDAAQEITDTIFDLYFVYDMKYNDLDVNGKEYKIIYGFDADSYKEEAFNKTEQELVNEILTLTSNYMLHDSETEEGNDRVRSEDIKKSMDNIYQMIGEEDPGTD